MWKEWLCSCLSARNQVQYVWCPLILNPSTLEGGRGREIPWVWSQPGVTHGEIQDRQAYIMRPFRGEKWGKVKKNLEKNAWKERAREPCEPLCFFHRDLNRPDFMKSCKWSQAALIQGGGAYSWPEGNSHRMGLTSQVFSMSAGEDESKLVRVFCGGWRGGWGGLWSQRTCSQKNAECSGGYRRRESWVSMELYREEMEDTMWGSSHGAEL